MFQSGGFGALFGGLSPPWRRDCTEPCQPVCVVAQKMLSSMKS